MLIQLPVKLPPSFEGALGYPRGFRWVALFWEPCGDEMMFDDGYCSADGNWWGFLQFVRHPRVKPWLASYNLGSSDDEATHWLLCDLESRDLFVGERAEVKAFVTAEVMKYSEHVPAESNMVSQMANQVLNSPEDMKKLLTEIRERMQQVPTPSIAEIEEKMRQDHEAVEKLVSELNSLCLES